MDREALRAGGIDVDDALGRLMGSEALLGRLLGKFLQDDNYRKLLVAAQENDADAALAAAHALKGVSGNLSITALFEVTTRQCELIRAGDWPAARDLMPQVTAAYEKAAAAVSSGGC